MLLAYVLLSKKFSEMWRGFSTNAFQVRATRREARHAVSHHGLVSVLLASHVQYRVPGSMWLCA